jgi:hypothetical protein
VLEDCPAFGNDSEDDIVLPHITFSHILSSKHTLIRRQFLLAPAYSTTIYSSQGQTFDKVGVDSTKPVFTHKRLYTALSMVRRHENLLVHLPP